MELYINSNRYKRNAIFGGEDSEDSSNYVYNEYIIFVTSSINVIDL